MSVLVGSEIVDAYLVDSFTDTPFAGNPAAVVLLDSPADAAWMQAVAAEFNQAETAFVVTGGAADEPKPLRWFTPKVEVALCGHATLAAAHILGGSQRFETLSGELRCTAGAGGTIEMDFPAQPSKPVDAPTNLAEGLPGVTVREVTRSETDLLVHLASAEQVRGLDPNIPALGLLDARVVIVTAAADTEGADIVSRVFAPAVGIPEDPVTGSAHCVLAPWWAPRLGRDELVAEQASPRGGTLRVTLRGDRVGLAGRAVTTLRGHLAS